MVVERLSTNQLFSVLTNSVLDNQNKVLDISNKINIGKKFNTAYEDPIRATRSIQSRGKIKVNDQSQRSGKTAQSELELGEVGISSMKNIIDRIYELTLSGGSENIDAASRRSMADEVRTLGETIVQLANSKIGSKFVFSGKQSSVQTVRLAPGASFASAIYKNNQDNGQERSIDGAQSSVSLYDALLTPAKPALVTGNNINPVLSTGGPLNFMVDNGSGTVTNFTAALGAGNNIANIVTNINAAFNAAGGLGSIATQNPPGYLELNTSLVVGSTPGTRAKIQILQSSNSTVVNEIGLKKQTTDGKDIGILNTLDALETAFLSNNSAGLRNLLDNIKSNTAELLKVQNSIGSFVNQYEAAQDYANDLGIKLVSDLSQTEDLDFTEASLSLSNAQAILNTSLQTTQYFFQNSLRRFIGGIQ